MCWLYLFKQAPAGVQILPGRLFYRISLTESVPMGTKYFLSTLSLRLPANHRKGNQADDHRQQ